MRTLLATMGPWLLVGVGLSLLVVCAVGVFVPPQLSFELADNRRLLPGYDYPLGDGQALRQHLESARPDARAELTLVTRDVFLSTRHSSGRHVTFFENWLLWIGGRFYEPLAKTQDVQRLIRGGAADCSQRSQILKSIVEQYGYQCQFAGLNGHVILLVQSDSDHWVADADYGAVFPTNFEYLQNEGQRTIEQVLQRRGYPKEMIRRYVALIQSKQDNVVLPSGSALSPRLRAIEVTSDWLKWWFPVVALISGILCARKRI